jgi:ribosomal protein S18 acetylase RimI-like enzyme
MELIIRAARADDLAAVLDLWVEAETEPGHTDNIDSLTSLLVHDPDALIVAEQRDAIVGSIVAAWDGWRGTIYRLAVAPSYRRQGLGGRLLRDAERRLKAIGAVRLQAIVVGSDNRATGFWRGTDWDEQVERLRFTRG